MDPELEPGHGQKADLKTLSRRLLTIQRYFPDFIESGPFRGCTSAPDFYRVFVEERG